MSSSDEPRRTADLAGPVEEVTGRRAPERVRIPAWLPPVLYAVLTLVLFHAFVFSGAMLFGSDTESLGYMARSFYAERLAAGDFPGWNPLLLGGTPFLESLAGGDSLYPPSLALLLLVEPFRALGWKLVLHVFLAGLFTYGWVRTLGRSRVAALLSGVAYMMAPFFVTLTWPGQDGKLFVTALTPLLFWAVEAWFGRRRPGGLAGVAAVVALVILTTHFQMAYFLFIATGAYALFRTVQEGRRAWRGLTGAANLFWAFLAAAVVGAAASAVQLLPALDYVTEYSRRTATTTEASPAENHAYASSWSLHPEEVVATLVVPEFVGSDVNGSGWTRDTYWGRNPFKLNHEYVGLGVILLALLAFVGRPRSELRWFFVALGGVALLYAMGTHTPVWGLAYLVLPGVKLFRAPSMVIFLTGFSAVTLMAFGVDRVLAWVAGADRPAARRGQLVLWLCTGALGLAALLASSGVLVSAWIAALYPGLDASKAEALARLRPFLVRGFVLATLLAAMLSGAVLLGRRRLLRGSGVVVVLALLLALDGLRVDTSFVTTRDFASFAAPDANVEFLEQRRDLEPPFRVLDMGGGGQDVRLAMFGLELAAGHHPNDLARYRELLGSVGSGPPLNLLRSPNLAHILNVEYLAWPAYRYGPLQQGSLAIAEGGEAVSATQVAEGRLHEIIYRIPTLPRARLVGRAVVIPDDDVLSTVMDSTFDPATTVLLAEPSPVNLSGATPEGSVEWIERSPDRLRLHVTSDRDAILVVADNWYPSWHVTVDGAEVPLLRAYLTLRAVPVPAGEHEVVMAFRASGLTRAGLGLSLAAWLLIALVAAFSWRRSRRASTS